MLDDKTLSRINNALMDCTRGNYDSALSKFLEVAVFNYELGEMPIRWIGVLQMATGDFRAAHKTFEALHGSDLRSRFTFHHLALSYAANPHADLRNGALALRLAFEAINMSPPDYWRLETVIAAAYAETGNFENAILYVQRARSHAPAGVQSAISSRLTQYIQREPYRLTMADCRVSLNSRETPCSVCGRAAFLVEQDNPLSGKCFACWQKGTRQERELRSDHLPLFNKELREHDADTMDDADR